MSLADYFGEIEVLIVWAHSDGVLCFPVDRVAFRCEVFVAKCCRSIPNEMSEAHVWSQDGEGDGHRDMVKVPMA